jgi:5-methylcytosine-specific restriction endonuclease McrA
MPNKPAKITTLRPAIERIDIRHGASVATERIRGRVLKTIRERIGYRDEYTCRMCGNVIARGVVDHIIPLHMGGRETDDNRQWLCVPCHNIKSEREGRQRT